MVAKAALRSALFATILVFLSGLLGAAPRVTLEPQRVTVTARDYRIAFHRWSCQWQMELRRGDQWQPVTKKSSWPELAVADSAGFHTSASAPVRLAHAQSGETVVLGLTTVLSGGAHVAKVDFVCREAGVLMRFRPDKLSAATTCWAMPRLTLDETVFDGYCYWQSPESLRSGRFSPPAQPSVYGVPMDWGARVDTATSLDAQHPAVIARSESKGIALGVVFLDYDTAWKSSRSFLQRYNAGHLFFYPAIATLAPEAQRGWAWLAPMPLEPAAAKAKVEQLLASGKVLLDGFRPLAPEPDPAWTAPQPDFPAALRREAPVDEIGRAIVYTVNESILSEAGIDLARKTGSDVLIRGWFKWSTPPKFAQCASLPQKAHQLGSLFGGGITCSALYHGENGLTESQVLAMATRGPEGQLIDAWGKHNCRHGSLSNPRYLDYLLTSCKQQIDAGADYLFMDEHTAVLQANEGFDDASIHDFQQHLLKRYGRDGWTATDPRWQKTFQIELANREVAPDGTMASFHYRAYLKSLPKSARNSKNPLAVEWGIFRQERDDRAWKWLTDAIRAYAASQGRRVAISANGLARYVDLQVLGVWGNWQTKDGRIDLDHSQLHEWRSLVVTGCGIAGRKLPVVLFHDWGFGGFPWLEVPPDDRRLWIRTRGAEIYAAGAFFAFPVLGPFGNDSRSDGTLPEIARQSAFYHRHAGLYLDAEFLGLDPRETDDPRLSVAIWRQRSPLGLIVHVINRSTGNGQPVVRSPAVVRLPIDRIPGAVRIVSPDRQGEEQGKAELVAGQLAVTMPKLEAYNVLILSYDRLPELHLTAGRFVPARQWERPIDNEFVVTQGGVIEKGWALPGLLQGRLHQEMRNPPTLTVNMPRGGALQVRVLAVATMGAKLQWQVDGHVQKTIDLPDRDHKNDSGVREYDVTHELPIPAGRHRVTLDNVGGDWVSIGWYAICGETVAP